MFDLLNPRLHARIGLIMIVAGCITYSEAYRRNGAMLVLGLLLGGSIIFAAAGARRAR